MFALLGEIEESPAILGPDALQARLTETLALLNKEHAPSIAAPLTVTGGFPEFLAVINDLGAAYPLARTLAEAFHPLAVRVAVARGEVNAVSPDPTPDAEQMDGPAFDEAAELLYRARKEDRFLLVSGGGETVDALANALFLVLYRMLQGWTPRQAEVVRLYRRHRRQRRVAGILGVSQQSVSASLAAAGYRMLEEAEGVLGAVLAGEGGRT